MKVKSTPDTLSDIILKNVSDYELTLNSMNVWHSKPGVDPVQVKQITEMEFPKEQHIADNSVDLLAGHLILPRLINK